MNYLIDNCYVSCGDSLFRQKIGIPMGTDCAPFLANLFLYSYEHEWMMKMKRLILNWQGSSTDLLDTLMTCSQSTMMDI